KQANQRVNQQDLSKVQERQEMAQVIGEISNNAISIATYEEREKINKLSLEKFQTEEKLGDKRHTDEGKQILAGYDARINQIQENIDRTYGIGSPNGMAIRAVTAALQAAAQNDTNGAIVALASPYLNNKIHEMTKGDTAKDKATNLIAHALLSAIEFQVTGKDPLTGAVAGVTGEVTAEIIAQKLYEKSPKELTASEKENISTLSQLAGGLAGALTAKANGTSEQQGGSFLTATAGADTAKRAVENNTFGVSYTEWKKEEKLREENPEAYEKLKEEQLQLFKDVLGVAADFTPVVGDMKSFAEAEDSIDYTLAVIGIIPGSEIVTKPLKAAKESIQKAKAAEKLGNVVEAVKHQQDAVRYIDNSVNGFYEAKEFRRSFEDVYGKGNVKSTTVPPDSAKNVKLAGKKHPVTGVPFDNKGFPIFDKYSAFDTRVNIEKFRGLSYKEQMKEATKDLAQAIRKGQIKESQFTPEQLKAIYKGEAKIPDYTWHHHQDVGRMQLIRERMHRETGHIGGEAIKKGK
ncbi:HNH endonuclease, partial [Rodentibacter pneumotropicus]